MTKRITSLILVTLLVVSLFAFVGCSNTDEMQRKIEELQIVLQQQTELLRELQNTNASNAMQIANLTEEIAKLQDQIDTMEKMGIEWFETFTMEEAYEKGIITKENLQSIADLYNSYTSLPLSELDADVVKRIKITKLYKINEAIATIDDVRLEGFYGVFGDDQSVYAVCTSCRYGGYGEGITNLDIDGVIFYGYSGPAIVIYVAKYTI